MPGSILAVLLPLLLATTLGAPAPLTAQATISGTVETPDQGGRRTANRYRGRGGSRAPKEVQPVPPVAFLEGALQGSGDPEESHVLLQQDTAFTPSAVAVQVGESVEFPNGDDFFHNVFSYSGPKRFDLGRYPRGETRSVVFDEPGIVQIFCEVHEHMRAVVVVTESPFHAVVSEDGTFSISGVPAGSHRLSVWHPDAGSEERSVEVADGATTDVTVELD